MSHYPVYHVRVGLSAPFDVSWLSDHEVHVHILRPSYHYLVVRCHFCIQELAEIIYPSFQYSLF